MNYSKIINPCLVAAMYFISPMVVAADITSETAGKFNSPVSTSSIFQVFVGLIVILVIIGASAWLLRRFGRFSSFENDVLRIHSTLSMGPRDKIVLLQVGNQQILVGMTPGRMQTLCELAEPIDFPEGHLKQHATLPDNIISAFKNHSFGNKH